MKTLSTTIKTLTCAIFILAISSVAHAQATRTWVSGVGDDVNPCSRTAPCKTFAGAISKTAAGGEIDALDPGGYGAVTITKSIAIDGTGTFASILASGTTGVIVNDGATATPNTITVSLRGLSINGAGTTLGTRGIRLLSGRNLNVENVSIQNFSTNGIEVAGTNASGHNLFVSNVSIFRTVTGIRLTSTTGAAVASINNSKIESNTTAGIAMEAGGFATVRDSVINFNGTGVSVTGSGNFGMLINNVINSNQTGVSVASGERMDMGNNTVLANNTNIVNNGTVRTWTNNNIDAAIPGPGVVTGLLPR